MSRMGTIRKPLKTSILKGIALFAATLCVFLVGAQFFFQRNTMYAQYQSRMTSILEYARGAIDTDDMAECIRAGVKSEKYAETQKELDAIKERTKVHYLYVVIPLSTDKTDNMKNVIAGVTAEEYENEPDVAVVELNGLTGDAYSPEVARKYLEAYGKEGITFFENNTQFGYDYTGMMVLRDSRGEKVAALCVDFEVSEIRSKMRENLLDIMIIVAILATLFATVFMVWADKNIVKPIRAVERDVEQLARKSHSTRDPDAMIYRAESIRTGNEVEALAGAVEKLSLDMRDYVKNLVSQERELTRLSSVTNRDALTHVGNRNAYDQYVENLQLKMAEGNLEFGILLADTNGLKKINEEYGHDKGDLYLQKACRVICEVFRHSPVFRLGGDEFAVMLLNADYMNRQSLADEAQTIYRRDASDEKCDPWEQVSVAFGLAVYDEKQDRSVQDVYERADQLVRQAKEHLKYRIGNAAAGR